MSHDLEHKEALEHAKMLAFLLQNGDGTVNQLTRKRRKAVFAASRGDEK